MDTNHKPDGTFFSYWFRGMEQSVEEMDAETRTMVFGHCGKACSESYTRQIYIEEYRWAKNIPEFLSRLNRRFPEAEFRQADENTIELTYHFCACDLVKRKYITSPLFCECSRQSLLYNWTSAMEDPSVTVELLESILAGAPACKFKITIPEFE